MGKKWCVYVHISPSGKYYVGITSQKPEARWRNGNGYKHNKYFTNAIQKYGWDNFQHEIIAGNITEKEAKNFEKILIEKLQSRNSQYGYNITVGGDGVVGISHYGEDNPFYGKHHSEEAKIEMSKKRIGKYTGKDNSFYGKHHSEETKQLISESNGLSVCQFDTEMNLLHEYQSANAASKETGIFHSMILGCCNNQVGYKTAGGYVWIFKSDLPNINFLEYKKRLNHEKLPKSLCQYSLSMDFVSEYESIGQASKITGISASNISLAISGKHQQAGGYIWLLKKDLDKMPFEEIKNAKLYKKPCCRAVYKFSLDMNLVQEFESKVEAGNSIGVTPQAIGYACNSKTHKSHGYIWWFKDDYERRLLNESCR